MRGYSLVAVLKLLRDGCVGGVRKIIRVPVDSTIILQLLLHLLDAGRVVCEPLHRVVESLEDVRRAGFSLVVGLCRDRVVDGCAGRCDRVIGHADKAVLLHDRDRHLGHVAQLIQPGVDEDGREHLRLLARVLHDAAHLDLDLRRGEVRSSPEPDTSFRVLEPLVDGVAGLALESLILPEMLDALLRLANGLQGGAVLAVIVRQRLVRLRVLHETHEPLVHGAVHHWNILSWVQNSELPAAFGSVLSCDSDGDVWDVEADEPAPAPAPDPAAAAATAGSWAMAAFVCEK